jgi:hypothetical protein
MVMRVDISCADALFGVQLLLLDIDRRTLPVEVLCGFE